MKIFILKRGLSPLFISFLCQHLVLNCNGQPKDVDLIFAKRHFGFSITSALIYKADVTRNIDKYWIHSTPLVGFEAGWSSYSHFDKKHSIIIGIFFGAFARNLNYEIPGSEFSPPSNTKVTTNGAASREFDFNGSLPIIFEKRWFLKSYNFCNVDIGFVLRYSPKVYETEYDTWNGNSFFYMELYTNPHQTIWINYEALAGYSWILRNKNILKLNFVANISFTSYGKGNYQFTLPNQPVVNGNYEVKGSYVGLSFGYVLTKANKLSKKISQNH
jgi:hypothetical protein